VPPSWWFMADPAPTPVDGEPTVVLIRHGETAWSRSGQHTGRTDLSLLPSGEDQAQRLAPLLSRHRFAVVLTSPLQRAVATARLAGLDHSEVDTDLREWDYGDLEGKTTPEIQTELPDWTIWSGPWPGGETIGEVAARADRVIAKVRSYDSDATVALVAHGHILRVLGARWLGQDPAAGRWLALSTASISELGWERGRPVLDYWNLTAALSAPEAD
jgi:broad specificity phosphatase PhoE